MPTADRSARGGARALTLAAVAVLGAAATPAGASWTRVLDLPASDVYSLWIRGDTLLAGVDQAAWTSVDGGANWVRSADLPGAPTTVEALRFERGILWAGTLGRGVFRSLDRGVTWQAFSAGLAGGLFDSHLYINDFETRGDSLFAATAGAGVFVLDLRAPAAWSHLGGNLEANQAGDVTDLERGPGGRLLATAGGNGYVFHLDPGASDWTISFLNNSGVAPGLQPSSVAWTGFSWLVAAQPGVYRSAAGVSPWTFFGHGLGSRTDGRLVSAGGRTFVAFNALAGTTFLFSGDDGQSWQPLESFPVYAYELGLREPVLWAARGDGLWRRDVSTVDAGRPVAGLALGVAGPHPAAGATRLRLRLPEAGRARLDVHDARGRRVARLLDTPLEAGEHEVAWPRQDRDAPGVHFARLEFAGKALVVRVVRLR